MDTDYSCITREHWVLLYTGLQADLPATAAAADLQTYQQVPYPVVCLKGFSGSLGRAAQASSSWWLHEVLTGAVVADHHREYWDDSMNSEALLESVHPPCESGAAVEVNKPPSLPFAAAAVGENVAPEHQGCRSCLVQEEPDWEG